MLVYKYCKISPYNEGIVRKTNKQSTGFKRQLLADKGLFKFLDLAIGQVRINTSRLIGHSRSVQD